MTSFLSAGRPSHRPDLFMSCEVNLHRAAPLTFNVHRTAPHRAGSHRSAPLRLPAAARNKNLGEDTKKKKSACNTRQPCLSPRSKEHKVTQSSARTPDITDRKEEEKKRRRRRRRDGQVECRINVPVTPRCSPGRSVSGTPPADVALGGKLYNP